MGEDWISFPELVRCWGAGLLLALALDHLRTFDLRRLRTGLPLLLLPVLLWQQPQFLRLAQHCEAAVLDSVPGQFFQHTFNLPLS